MSYPSLLMIPSKPNAPISYTFIPAYYFQPHGSVAQSHYNLIVFINGLGLPASSWTPCISSLQSKLKDCPSILTYDRYGQGLTTTRDPLDDGHGYGHDFMDAANDLHSIILVIAKMQFGFNEIDVDSGKLRIICVAASIGVPITRLYAHSHPRLVSAILCLDSNIPNANYSDFLPDPRSPSFDPASVISPDCSLEQYTDARAKLVNMFDLRVKNSESLDRRNGPQLLPHSDRPKLVGSDGKGPWLTVVGHDPVTFSDMSLERMGTPKSLSMKFTNPYWAKYNEGLTKITDDDKCQGVKIAKGCGHFIQSDDPDFVAEEIKGILQKLEGDSAGGLDSFSHEV